MSSIVPVYTDLNGVHDITLFSESEDGLFRRTSLRPLHKLRHNIVGISYPLGELIAPRYDHHPRAWSSATVKPISGRPSSYYHFLRLKTRQRKTIVATLPSVHGRIAKLQLHELIFRSGMSQGSWMLFMNKYIESLDIWPETALLSPALHPAAVMQGQA